MTAALPQYWTSPNGNRATTRYIAFHHAAFTYAVGDAVRSIYTYHRSKWPLYNAAGYHVICQQDTDGIHAYQVNPHDMQGAGVADRNDECYHVCCATNFTHTPSDAWLDAAAHALAEAQRRYPHAQIVGHKDIARPAYPTACPGPLWAAWKGALFTRVNELLGTPPPPPPPPGARITAESSILAPPRCTQAQAVAAILSQPHGGYTSGDIGGAIVPAYFATCAIVGVDPCLVIAQLIHETGNLTSWWASRPQRNPAGIGVTDQTSKSKPPKGVKNWAWDDSKHLWCYGVSFPSWVNDAIPAHVGRLLAYATKAADRTEAQQALVKQALSYRALTTAYQGQAPSLRGLGGRWAVPGTNYPDQIAVIAERLRTTRT